MDISDAAIQEMNAAPAIPSSSILLVRDGLHGLEVLMMKRSEALSFVPGAYVFPGGKVDPGDDACNFRDFLPAGFTEDDLPYRIAVIRELFEEAGILLVENHQDYSTLNRDNFFGALQAAQSIMPIDQLVYFSHWVTPLQIKKRFDTRFYVAAYKGDFSGKADGSEMTALMWVRPLDILDQWDREVIPIMFPTRLNLTWLAEASTVEEALAQASARKIMPVLPDYSVHPETGKITITIPEDTGYGLTQASEKDLKAEAMVLKNIKII